ncbi:HNH endonuclease signature motif containing protein [Mycobacterium palustre]|nr:HNH endonuclease signature motif containing protein [Mycobacterium palustre]MCV7100069.1 HNH endonuclease [Mycobacterium palustre]
MQELRRDKLTADPVCEWTSPNGRCRRPADQVDHIVPLAEGGARYDWDNLQSLCTPHHKQKTTQDALRGKKRAR